MRKKEIIGYGICVAILIWICISTIEVWMKQKTPDVMYSKANCYNLFTTHTKEMRVVNCEVCKADDTFMVTLEDIRGDLYSYYDTEYQYNGWVKVVTTQGNLIINVKE